MPALPTIRRLRWHGQIFLLHVAHGGVHDVFCGCARTGHTADVLRGYTGWQAEERKWVEGVGFYADAGGHHTMCCDGYCGMWSLVNAQEFADDCRHISMTMTIDFLQDGNWIRDGSFARLAGVLLFFQLPSFLFRLSSFQQRVAMNSFQVSVMGDEWSGCRSEEKRALYAFQELMGGFFFRWSLPYFMIPQHFGGVRIVRNQTVACLI
jgi:hypothetical protein